MEKNIAEATWEVSLWEQRWKWRWKQRCGSSVVNSIVEAALETGLWNWMKRRGSYVGCGVVLKAQRATVRRARGDYDVWMGSNRKRHYGSRRRRRRRRRHAPAQNATKK